MADIVQKVSKALKVLMRVCDYVPRDILLVIYRIFIEHHFQYCNVVWGHLTDGLSHRLQTLQNRAARIITRSPFDAPSLYVRKLLVGATSNINENSMKLFGCIKSKIILRLYT